MLQKKFQNNYGNFCKAVNVVLAHIISMPYDYNIFLCKKNINSPKNTSEYFGSVKILLEY